MRKLKDPIAAAHLRKHTHLKAKRNNPTRWSSTAAMLQRYKEIKEFLAEIELNDMAELMPNFERIK